MKMTTKDALNVLGLKVDATFEVIKGAYRKACMQYHPDRNPAGLEMMKIVNAAYNALTDYVAGSVKEDVDPSINLGEELNAALNAIIGFGLTIEICGSWLWVSGDTRPYKEELKAAGFKWAPKKMMWHFRPADYKSFSRGKYTMDEIRARHGSVSVKPQAYSRIEARG